MKNVSDSAQSGLLTPDELAKRIKVDVGTLQNWRSRGIGIPYVKFGTSHKAPVRYRLEDVINWEKSLPRFVPSVAKNVEEKHGRL